MIEILPNWHPVFVHFTIALLSMSVVFYTLKALLPEKNTYQPALSLLATSNLWIGTGFAVMTAIAGWFAYNSVAHDTPSHLAMTEHRNWALLTLAVFMVLTLWSLLQKNKAALVFVIALLIAGGLLATTGWLGAEAVYRYGLGVKSLPKSSGEGHAHQHAEGEGHSEEIMKKPIEKQQSMQEHNTTPHQHAEGEAHSKVDAIPTHDDTPHQHNHSNLDKQPAKEKEAQEIEKSHNETPHTH